jgi:hypothetical protein
MGMKILAWYSAIMLTLTTLLAAYGFLITKETPWTAMLAILILYTIPAAYIWITIFKKQK